MSLLDIDERILELIELVDFDKSPIDDIKELTGPVDIGIIEGGVSTEENVEVLRLFREHCRILVAIGECALTGGVPSMRNVVPLEECLEEAFVKGPSVVNGAGPERSRPAAHSRPGLSLPRGGQDRLLPARLSSVRRPAVGGALGPAQGRAAEVSPRADQVRLKEARG